MRKWLWALLALVVPAQSLSAEVHRHGEGFVQLTEDDGSVEVVVRIPALDLVGFEQIPKAPAEHEKLHQGAMLLMDATRVLNLPEAARCQVQVSHVRSSLLDHLRLDVITSDPDIQEGDRQDRRYPTGSAASVTHADFLATYSFACKEPAALRSIEATLFQFLPGLQVLEVHAVTDLSQGIGQLTRAAPRIIW